MKVLYFDLETSPSMAWVWSTGKQYISHDQILEPTRIICIGYKWEGNQHVECLTWDKKLNDKSMLEEFSKVLDQADVAVGHNGKGFDIKHINARLAYHSLPPSSVVSLSDSLLLSRKKFKLASHSLAYLCKYFKVGKKMSTGGIDLWLKVWLEKDEKALKKMVSYCKNDVKILEQIYLRLKPYLDTKHSLAASIEDRGACPSCGGKLYKKDIKLVTQLKKVQRYKCSLCSKVSTDGHNLLEDTKEYPR